MRADDPEVLQLTDLQIEVLRVLWTEPGLSLAEVTDRMYERRELSQSTVATLLSRLLARGLVRRAGPRRGYRYHAAVTEGTVRRAQLHRLREVLFQGDDLAVISELLGGGRFSGADREYVRELLARQSQRKRRS